MAPSSSPPIPVKGASGERRASREHRGFDAAAALLSSSYLSASPIAQEILARDLAECYDDNCLHDHQDGGGGGGHWDYSDDESVDFDAEGDLPPEDARLEDEIPPPLNVTYGSLRPSIAAEAAAALGTPGDLLGHHLPRTAERSLLRDNHIIPPKHPRDPERDTVWRKLYRRLFSTKVNLDDVHDAVDADTANTSSSSLTRVHSAGSRRPPAVAVVETTPLLQHKSQPYDEDGYLEGYPTTVREEAVQWEAAVAAHAIRTTWQREAKTLWQYSRALIVTFLLHYSVTVTSVFTVGRIGMLELGAVSLATMTANITCYAPVQGLSTCLDTLCAQAFGSGHKHLVGLQLQRMTYLLWMLLLPVAVLWFNASSVLGLIVPEPQTAALAGSYLRILILGTPGVAAFESGKRFVQAQGLFHATTWVLLVGAPLNVLANWFFVWRMGWGFSGAAAAVVFTQNLLPLLLFLYVRLVQGMECWNGLTRKALSNWGPMLKLALPGMIMVEAQYFAFEVLTLAVSQFGSAHLAAQSVLVTITSTTYNIPFPLAVSASTRVANLIGARLSDAARMSAKVAIIAALLVGLFNMTVLFTLRAQLPYLFTDDDTVASLTSAALPICALMQILDALAAMSHGLLRGIGRQGIGGYTNLSSYYLIALPISFATAFQLDWKLQGLWFGVTLGLGMASSMEFLYLYCTSWDKAVEEAQGRMAGDADARGGVAARPRARTLSLSKGVRRGSAASDARRESRT